MNRVSGPGKGIRVRVAVKCISRHLRALFTARLLAPFARIHLLAALHPRFFPPLATRHSPLLPLLACLALLAFAPLAQAQSTLTFNVAAGDWNTAGSWDPVHVPTSIDTVYINSSRTATIDSGESGAASVVRVGYGGGQSGTLNANGNLTASSNVQIGYGAYQNPASGTFNLGNNTTVTIGGSLTLGEEHASGTFNQGANTSVGVGGILTVGGRGNAASTYTVPETGTLTLGSDLRIAYGGWDATGTFTYNNPDVTLNVPGNVTIGLGVWKNPASGTFNQGSNTSVTIGGTMTVGSGYSDSVAGGVYTMGSGSSLKLTSGTSDLLIGYATSDLAKGSFTCNGTLEVGRHVTIGYSSRTAYPSTGSFTQGAGSDVTINGTLTVGGYGSTSGVYNLGAAGVLTVNGATVVSATGNTSGTFNLNGGTVNLPRQTTINTGGTFTHTAGILRFGLAGTGAGASHDQVTVSGGTLALGGDLEVQLEGGYTPGYADSFTIVTVSSGTLSGTFANAPTSGQRYSLGMGSASFIVTYTSTSVVLSDYNSGVPTTVFKFR